MKRTGFFAIVGRPNVGKSTLLNHILGEKIAIVSSKPQTTRGRILGIETRGEDQFVFIDTPGIFSAKNSLGDYMVKVATGSMQDGDAVVLVADAAYKPGDVEEKVIAHLKRTGIPAILALNKVDLCRREQIAEAIAAYAALHDFAAVVPISAKSGRNVDELLDECRKFIHESDWIFEEDMITDQTQRQLASEIIREKILRTIDREIPHGVAVVIEEYREEGELTRIRAELVCEKNLATVAHRLELGDALLLGNGESHGGGRDRSGILCDVMESLIAAAYLDGGFEAAKGIVMRHILPMLGEVIKTHDYKTEFQELVQQKRGQVVTYELVDERGPDHCKEFSVRVLVNGVPVGEGVGSSKKRAEQVAAGQAIERLFGKSE